MSRAFHHFDTESERLQTQRDHEVKRNSRTELESINTKLSITQTIWGIIRKDERVLNRIGPAQPRSSQHFLLQHGDYSDEALATFDFDGMQLGMSPSQQQEEKEKVVLKEWHTEWAEAERQPKLWTQPLRRSGRRDPSRLTQPILIDGNDHQKSAEGSELNYFGLDEDAPLGNRVRKTQKANEAHRKNAESQMAWVRGSSQAYASTRYQTLVENAPNMAYERSWGRQVNGHQFNLPYRNRNSDRRRPY